MIMEEPAMLIAMLKAVLVVVTVVAAVAVGRELLAMARGRALPRPVDEKGEEH